ncbi:hypothetical protein ACVGXF_07490, partial [Enterobacter hormaechei]
PPPVFLIIGRPPICKFGVVRGMVHLFLIYRSVWFYNKAQRVGAVSFAKDFVGVKRVKNYLKTN